MAGVSVTFSGLNALLRGIDDLNPAKNRKITEPALIESALLVMRTASQTTIRRSGDPVTNRVTSQTGALRRSLGVSFSLDKSGLPRFIEAGTNLFYGAIHEFGGTFSVKSSTVREHTRTRAFGKSFKAFTVPSHTRSAHSVTFPKRAFLAPALDIASRQFEAIQIKHWDRATR